VGANAARLSGDRFRREEPEDTNANYHLTELTTISGILYCLDLPSQKNVNKLWCESTTNPVPVLRIAASRGFSQLTKNVI